MVNSSIQLFLSIFLLHLNICIALCLPGMTKQPADDEEFICRVCTKKKQKAAQYQAYKARLAQKKAELEKASKGKGIGGIKIKQEPFDPNDSSAGAQTAPVTVKEEVCETVVPMETDEIVSVVSTPVDNSPVGAGETEMEQMEVSQASDAGKKGDGSQLESIPEEADSIPSSIEKMLATVEKELDGVIGETEATVQEATEQTVESMVDRVVAEESIPPNKSTEGEDESALTGSMEEEESGADDSPQPPLVTPVSEVVMASSDDSGAATPPVLTPKGVGSPQSSSAQNEEIVSAPVIVESQENAPAQLMVQESSPDLQRNSPQAPQLPEIVEAQESKVSPPAMTSMLAPPSITKILPMPQSQSQESMTSLARSPDRIAPPTNGVEQPQQDAGIEEVVMETTPSLGDAQMQS